MDDLQLVPVEDVVKLIIFLTQRVHPYFTESLEYTSISESEIDGTLVHHEECSVVDDTSLEESFQDEFSLFKLSVDLNDSTLKKVQLVSISTHSLQDFTLLHGLRLQRVDNIVEAWVILSQEFEVWNLHDASLDEPEHLVIVLIDALLNLLPDLRIDGYHFVELLSGKLSQVAVFAGLNGGGGETAVNERDLSKQIARSQPLHLVGFTLA